jgi:hypothetical protein
MDCKKKKNKYKKCDKCDKKPLWFCGIISLCPEHAPRDYDPFTGEYTEFYDKPYHVKNYNDEPYIIWAPPTSFPMDRCRSCDKLITEENKDYFYKQGIKWIPSKMRDEIWCGSWSNSFPSVPVDDIEWMHCIEDCGDKEGGY